jgi:hypothetical protein
MDFTNYKEKEKGKQFNMVGLNLAQTGPRTEETRPRPRVRLCTKTPGALNTQ